MGALACLAFLHLLVPRSERKASSGVVLGHPLDFTRMASLDTAAVAALLREYGQRAALRGGNFYRAKAYIRAADSLSALAEPLDQMIAQGRLREIPGVGDVIADIIIRLHANGTHPCLEAMRQEIPASVLEIK